MKKPVAPSQTKEARRAYYIANKDRWSRYYAARRDALHEARRAAGQPVDMRRAPRATHVAPYTVGDALAVLACRDALGSWRAGRAQAVKAATVLSRHTTRARAAEPELAAALPLIADMSCQHGDDAGAPCQHPAAKCIVDYTVWHAASGPDPIGQHGDPVFAPLVPPAHAVRYLCEQHAREHRATTNTHKASARGHNSARLAHAQHRERCALLHAGAFAAAPYGIAPGTPEGDMLRKAFNRALLSSLLTLHAENLPLPPESRAIVQHATATLAPGKLDAIRAFNANIATLAREIHAQRDGDGDGDGDGDASGDSGTNDRLT